MSAPRKASIPRCTAQRPGSRQDRSERHRQSQAVAPAARIVASRGVRASTASRVSMRRTAKRSRNPPSPASGASKAAHSGNQRRRLKTGQEHGHGGNRDQQSRHVFGGQQQAFLRRHGQGRHGRARRHPAEQHEHGQQQPAAATQNDHEVPPRPAIRARPAETERSTQGDQDEVPLRVDAGKRKAKPSRIRLAGCRASRQRRPGAQRAGELAGLSPAPRAWRVPLPAGQGCPRSRLPDTTRGRRRDRPFPRRRPPVRAWWQLPDCPAHRKPEPQQVEVGAAGASSSRLNPPRSSAGGATAGSATGISSDISRQRRRSFRRFAAATRRGVPRSKLKSMALPSLAGCRSRWGGCLGSRRFGGKREIKSRIQTRQAWPAFQNRCPARYHRLCGGLGNAGPLRRPAPRSQGQDRNPARTTSAAASGAAAVAAGAGVGSEIEIEIQRGGFRHRLPRPGAGAISSAAGRMIVVACMFMTAVASASIGAARSVETIAGIEGRPHGRNLVPDFAATAGQPLQLPGHRLELSPASLRAE
jgi:hypothetical protein